MLATKSMFQNMDENIQREKVIRQCKVGMSLSLTALKNRMLNQT